MIKRDTMAIKEEVATSFVIDIIESAMERFKIAYTDVYKVLKKLRYWEVFNDSEVTTVGAHEGIEPVLKEIETELRNSR